MDRFRPNPQQIGVPGLLGPPPAGISPQLSGIMGGAGPTIPQNPALPAANASALATIPPSPAPIPAPIGPPAPPTGGPNDPILVNLLGGPRQPLSDPELAKPETKRRGYAKLPEAGYIMDVARQDLNRYMVLLQRFQHDLVLYRQKHPDNVPPIFDPLKEMAFKTATISNIVNKLTNMSSAGDWRWVIPFQDEKSKEGSQIVENWLSYVRQCEEEYYSLGGGDADLQWDEFWYLYQYGRVVARILPDPGDQHHPFNESLLDPSTCFPTFGDSKEGMVRMTRIYQSKVIDILKVHSQYDDKLEQRIVAKIGYDGDDIGRYYLQEGRVIEYWDPWNRALYFRDIEIVREPHRLGYVPFVYVVARGEPRGVVTPEGAGFYHLDENNNAITLASTREDLAEKGVSVYHHIRNTHRMSEVVYTLLISEVLKAQNPAVINYSAPQMVGQAPPPLAYYPGAANQRVLNAQKVEIVPTSPRPTDTSPVLNRVQSDITEGTINPAMYGSMDGSNIAGFAVESLISAARDTVLPYTSAWTRFQALKGRMYCKQYLSHVAPAGTPVSVAMEGQYGSSPSKQLTPQIVIETGIHVMVEMVGVSDQALPSMVQTSSLAVEKGLWSRRKAMEHLGEKDPAKMLQDIITERAIEHPEIMENIIIPQMFMRQGQNDLAYMWGILVVLPKLISTMGGLMGGMGMPPTGQPPQPGSPPAGPQPNGQSNPMAGRDRGPSTGPNPGQGRGPQR